MTEIILILIIIANIIEVCLIFYKQKQLEKDIKELQTSLFYLKNRVDDMQEIPMDERHFIRIPVHPKN